MTALGPNQPSAVMDRDISIPTPGGGPVDSHVHREITNDRLLEEQAHPRLENVDRAYQYWYRHFNAMPLATLDTYFDAFASINHDSFPGGEPGGFATQDDVMRFRDAALRRVYGQKIQDAVLQMHKSNRGKSRWGRPRQEITQVVTEKHRHFLAKEYLENGAESALARQFLNQNGFKNWSDLMDRMGVSEEELTELLRNPEANLNIDISSALLREQLESAPNRRKAIVKTMTGTVTSGLIGGLISGGVGAVSSVAGYFAGKIGRKGTRFVAHDLRMRRKNKGEDNSFGYNVTAKVVGDFMKAYLASRAAAENNTKIHRADPNFESMHQILEKEGQLNILNAALSSFKKSSIENLKGVVGEYHKIDALSRKWELGVGLTAAILVGMGTAAGFKHLFQDSVNQAAAAQEQLKYIQQLRDGSLQLDLDGDGISHAVKAFTDVSGQEHMHFMLESQDILRWQEHFANNFDLQAFAGYDSANPFALHDPSSLQQYLLQNPNLPTFHAGELSIDKVHELIAKLAMDHGQAATFELFKTAMLTGGLTPAVVLGLESLWDSADRRQTSPQKLEGNADKRSSVIGSSIHGEQAPGRAELLSNHTSPDAKILSDQRLFAFEEKYKDVPAGIKERGSDMVEKYQNMKVGSAEALRQGTIKWPNLNVDGSQVVIANLDPSRMSFEAFIEKTKELFQHFRASNPAPLSLCLTLPFTEGMTNGYFYSTARRYLDHNWDTLKGLFPEEPLFQIAPPVPATPVAGTPAQPPSPPSPVHKLTGEQVLYLANQTLSAKVEEGTGSDPSQRFDRARDKISFLPAGSGLDVDGVPTAVEWQDYARRLIRSKINDFDVDNRVLVYDQILRLTAVEANIPPHTNPPSPANPLIYLGPITDVPPERKAVPVVVPAQGAPAQPPQRVANPNPNHNTP